MPHLEVCMVTCPNWESGGMPDWKAICCILRALSRRMLIIYEYGAFIVFIKDICKAPKLQSICN